nr:tripartite tricarboxylate transporter TctB family protein [uncultured Dongia sp.]
MTEINPTVAGRVSTANRPWWVGLPIIVMGAIWLYGGGSIRATTGFIGIGPAAIVDTVGAALVVLGILLVIQALRGVPFTPEDEEGANAAAPPSRKAFCLALGGIVLPLGTIQWLGFPLTAMLVFTLVTHAFGSRRTVLDLAIGLALSSFSWYGFSKLGIGLGHFLPLIG